MAEVNRMMLDAGIRKFKAATIAEAEMLAMIQAPDVLLAYQPTGPKIRRLINLIEKYPATKFSCLVDYHLTAQALSQAFVKAGLRASVYLDLNLGMNRTGILPEKVKPLYQLLQQLPALDVLGLHAYDGHIKDHDLALRIERCRLAFEPVISLKKDLEKMSGRPLTLIAGGSPTCFIHGAFGDRECSPGTFVFWDKGYAEQLSEQPFVWAAVLMTRVISIPATDMICVDLGNKSVASENPQPRVFFLNALEAIPTLHSEEHLVLKVADSGKFQPGDLLYGIPWHICPSVALYDNALVVENNRITDTWKIIARSRAISV